MFRLASLEAPLKVCMIDTFDRPHNFLLKQAKVDLRKEGWFIDVAQTINSVIQNEFVG